ncbi:dienelactone hydrolase [Legionella quinlivanii]|uniref:Dienelactone hydrolase n=1 Tax=Legionella quinlivanii TaxID=45073 RepID=A0A0W0XYB0_9GAMM|nr:dienelactone hydrolase family protein [Legionella quinlivanii]KTD49707.1 dienelactone hydrolase [Legionella quinlivanii]MCW8451931.1 dienelactone hydrolase family protein [Legionella quinlivanii]SEG23015.1 Dienelactone hydrolase [Legionella quinlivanii DSM 21216]STY09872.1 carboxymethylenebutenolidase [Legionella quinlivanii]
MHSSNYLYHHGEQELHGFLAYDDSIDQPRPAVIIAHDWSGRNEFACHKAEMLAKELGYVGFALDMYGHGRIGYTTDEKIALMQPLAGDRRLLRDRIRAGFDAVIAMSEVDSARVAAIGFCFGGLCVLDLARSGAELAGVVSFHGLLDKPKHIPNQKIQAKVLALHGYDDPMVPPQQLNDFCQEMTEAKVDWQVHQYGLTKHAFTNPDAHDPDLGTIYNPIAAKRSMQAMKNFLQEIFK